MARAEDKGASLFAFTGNRCYINQTSRSQATSAGMGIEMKTRDPLTATAGQKMLYFGMDGTLNILSTENPDGKVLFSIGNSAPLEACDKLNGGLMSSKNGTWGENCNGIIRPYYRWTYLGRW